MQRAPCELAVSCFAAASEAETPDFTDRVWREVVVQHEVGIAQAFQTIDHLLCIFGAESNRTDRLRFTAGEQCRTVCTWQQTDHGFDRADLVRFTAVNPLAILQDSTANDFSFQLLNCFTGSHLSLAVFFGVGFFCFRTSQVQSV